MTHIRSLLAGAACALLISTLGCGKTKDEVPARGVPTTATKGTSDAANATVSATPVNADKNAKTAKSDTPKSEKAGDVKVSVADYDAIVKLIASKKGKVVVVDCWSTGCDPCKKEFHNLVEIHKKYPDKVACISVDCDYIGDKTDPKTLVPDVLEFLQSQNATFDNVLSSTADSDIYEKFEIPNGIPAVLVYDASGKIVKRFTTNDAKSEAEGFYGHVKKMVDQLIEGR